MSFPDLIRVNVGDDVTDAILDYLTLLKARNLQFSDHHLRIADALHHIVISISYISV